MEPDLVIFGALHRDLVGVLEHEHVSAASNPVEFSLSTGGVGANVARAAVRSGHISSVRLVTPVGEKGLDGDIANVGFADIDVCAVPVPGTRAGRYVAIMDSEGQLVSGYADTAACNTVEHGALLNECPASARTVVLDANLSPSTLEGLVTALPIYRIALGVSPAKAHRLLPLADRIELLICNRREAAAMTSLPTDTDARALSDALAAAGFETHVLTDGQAPVIVNDADGTASIDVPAITTTGRGTANGAGDALSGATIAAVHAGLALREAVSSAGLPAASGILRGS